MRDLSDEVIVKQSEESTRPVDIYDIYLGSQTAVDDNTLFFAVCPESVNFWDMEGTPQEYLPLGLARSPVKHNIDLAVDYFNVSYDNVDRAMSALIAGTDFRDKRVVLRTVFLDQLASPDDAILVFDGVMDKPVITQSSLQVQVVSRLNLKLKTGRLYQLMCPWKFGGARCAYDRTATKSTGSVTAGSTTSLIYDTSRTEADDYWKHGLIHFTSGDNNGVKRRITDYDLDLTVMSLDIVLENTPAVGDTYDIYRGCDKTLAWCKDTLSNQANFGGFHTLPVELEEGE